MAPLDLLEQADEVDRTLGLRDLDDHLAGERIADPEQGAALGLAGCLDLEVEAFGRPGVGPGLFGSNPGRLVKAVFEAKGSSAGVRG
jgi:hypothetical protein